MNNTQKNKIGNILFHEHSWHQKEIDDLEMKLEDIIDAYEQTKQCNIHSVVEQSEQLVCDCMPDPKCRVEKKM